MGPIESRFEVIQEDLTGLNARHMVKISGESTVCLENRSSNKSTFISLVMIRKAVFQDNKQYCYLQFDSYHPKYLVVADKLHGHLAVEAKERISYQDDDLQYQWEIGLIAVRDNDKKKKTKWVPCIPGTHKKIDVETISHCNYLIIFKNRRYHQNLTCCNNNVTSNNGQLCISPYHSNLVSSVVFRLRLHPQGGVSHGSHRHLPCEILIIPTWVNGLYGDCVRYVSIATSSIASIAPTTITSSTVSSSPPPPPPPPINPYLQQENNTDNKSPIARSTTASVATNNTIAATAIMTSPPSTLIRTSTTIMQQELPTAIAVALVQPSAPPLFAFLTDDERVQQQQQQQQQPIMIAATASTSSPVATPVVDHQPCHSSSYELLLNIILYLIILLLIVIIVRQLTAFFLEIVEA